MKEFFSGLGTELISIIISTLIGLAVGGGTGSWIGYRVGIKQKIKIKDDHSQRMTGVMLGGGIMTQTQGGNADEPDPNSD